MQTLKKEEFTIVGIAKRTSNQNGQAEKDIPQLWNTFMNEGIGNRIPHKKNETVYALYTDYEGDYTKPYTIIIGHEVTSLDNIPEDMTVNVIPSATYAKFIAKGDLTKTVYKKWLDIWNTDLNRTYTTDLEVYGEKAMNPTDGEAEILIAIE